MPTFDNNFSGATQVGSALEKLVTSLYAGDPEAKQQERAALLSKRQKDNEYRDLQIGELRAKQQARQATASAPSPESSVAEAFFPGAGADVLKYRQAGGVTPPPVQKDDEGFDMPLVPMDRPRGYTPQEESRFTNASRALALSRALPGKTNYAQMQGGEGKRQENDVIGEALSGLRPTSQAYIVQGKPAYAEHQGRILDVGTGGLNEGGQQAQANVVETGARAGKERAQGGQANAMAGLAKAKTEQVGKEASKAPPGYRYTPDRAAMEAVPGGPADTKQQGVFNQDTASLTSLESDLDRLEREAIDVKTHPGLKGITGLRGAVPNIPGTAAADAEAKLHTLKSQIITGVLQNMRANSKTGGALGSVSDAENKMLASNLAALEKAQSFDQFQKELDGIVTYTKSAKERLRGAYNLKHQNRAAAQGAAPAAAPAASDSGVTVSNW